ncbi:MAG: Gfo/Idh/MocA family oxidoreductase [Prevotellaceae bacterium]|jgi:predicted dehydrogenase|nr:Gfo/Idh/MocA family oxidoreductase [Prevotellaceae bacterium]
MPANIRWGIVGCGDVCEVKSGPAFYKCARSSLAAVMRRDAAKAKDFALRHGAARYYSNADDLINDTEVDIVYVATPPESHAELAIKALKACKPVYVEKPMAISYQECLRMLDAAKAYQQKLFVAYYRRSLPYFLKIKELIDIGAIGKPQVVQAGFFRPPLFSDKDKSLHTWRINKEIAGGGYFYDMASHTIDILMFLLGKITKANGVTGNVAGWYEAEDVVSASFLFESGAVGSAVWLYASSETEQKDWIKITGDKGSIRFSTFAFSSIELSTEVGISTFACPKPEHIQQAMVQSIVDELLGSGICPSTGETGALTSRVMEEIYK